MSVIFRSESCSVITTYSFLQDLDMGFVVSVTAIHSESYDISFEYSFLKSLVLKVDMTA